LPHPARQRSLLCRAPQTLPLLAVDHAYLIGTKNRAWITHYGAQARYKSDLPERLIWYATALGIRFRLPLEIVLILLVEHHAPAIVPEEYVLALGDLLVSVRYRVVRLWEMDPAPALQAGRVSLLPWVTLMRSSPEALQTAAAKIASAGAARTAAEFVVLGGLRYDKSDLLEMLGRLNDMLSDEIIRESSFYRMILDEGTDGAGRRRSSGSPPPAGPAVPPVEGPA